MSEMIETLLNLLVLGIGAVYAFRALRNYDSVKKATYNAVTVRMFWMNLGLAALFLWAASL